MPASACDSALEKDVVIESLIPTVEHVAPVVETTAALDVSGATFMEEVQDEIAVVAGKNKKKKYKKNKARVLF